MSKAGAGPSTSAAERAYLRIRDDIFEGRHLPGSMLGEAALAAELGMSRTPVRAALVRLQDEGWVVIYPKRGALVQGLDERDVVELAEARYLLETASVRGAQESSRQRLADRLDGSLQAQREAITTDDLRAFIDLTLSFHRGFVEAGGNRVLAELYDRLSDRHRFSLFASGDRLRATREQILADHVELVEHLRDGRAEEFAAVLRRHISAVPSHIRGTGVALS